MGYEIRRLEITVRLDNHGSDEQRQGRELWDELRREIEAVLAQDKYKPINPIA